MALLLESSISYHRSFFRFNKMYARLLYLFFSWVRNKFDFFFLHISEH